MRSPTARHNKAPASTTPPRPENQNTIACAVYRYAAWGAPAALALLIVLATLAAGGAA